MRAKERPASGRADLITFALILVRVGVLIVAVWAGISRPLTDDLERFAVLGSAPGTPYRDIEVEYAPVEIIVIRTVACCSAATTAAGVAMLAFLADLATWGALRSGWGIGVARSYLWLGTPLLLFIYTRFDLLPVALATCGAALVFRGRERSGGLLASIGVLSKLWGGVVIPSFVIAGRRRAVLWTISFTILGTAAWVAVGGVRGIADVLTFRQATGWGVESVVGVLVWIATGEEVRLEAGAPRVGTTGPAYTMALAVLLVVLLGAVWVRSARTHTGVWGRAPLAATAAVLVCSPLFSLQYSSWILPWGAIAGAEGDPRSARIVGAVSATTALLFVAYSPDRVVAVQAALVVRNLLVVWLILRWLRPIAVGTG